VDRADRGGKLESFSGGLPVNGEDVERLESAMLELPQVSCPVIHRFGPGTYIREVTLPAGTLAIGHHQNFDHTNIFLRGRVTILLEDGTSSELRAPMIFVGKPGRKIGFIHEEVVWLNVYATNERDVAKLEEKFLTKSNSWQSDSRARESIRLLQGKVDSDDLSAFAAEVGMTTEQIREQSENPFDQTAFPHGGYKVKVGPSAIEGKGLFATADIEPGEFIAPARVLGKRTPAGRFTNHSLTPNAEMQRGIGSDINLIALSPISGCHGGQDGEEITINYRNAYGLTKQIGGE
jgi:hypothetical protein